MVKILSGSNLPEDRIDFCTKLTEYFPDETLDLKFAMMKGLVKQMVRFCTTFERRLLIRPQLKVARYNFKINTSS